MWQKYINATEIDDVLGTLAEYGNKARIIAGGTDLLLELEKDLHPDTDILIDVSRIPGLDRIVLDEDDNIHLGPLVTHNHCVASKLIRERALPLAQAAWSVGAPQIRNRGTIAGNLITASPANDTISPLMALGAKVLLRSEVGDRIIPLDRFYQGVRKTIMSPNEFLLDIFFPAIQVNQNGIFLKLGLRQAQAISVVNVTIVLSFDETIVKRAAITLGAVAPTIIRAVEAENFITEKILEKDIIKQAAQLARDASSPIDDIRGSAIYRKEMVRVLTTRGLRKLANGSEPTRLPIDPVLLWGKEYSGDAPYLPHRSDHIQGTPIVTRINGKIYTFEAQVGKSLLELIREDAGLIGTKEGCSEGECGACTVFLDGMAVMSCLVAAERAHGAEIVTIEGLSKFDKLNSVQEAFIESGAVQCGYCTPGFIMSATKLLEEVPKPTNDQVRQAITGNLCRCTGYYKIIEAIEKASLMEVENG